MAAMAVHLGGCATWKVQELAPEQVIAEQTPDLVQVTKTDATRLTIWEPRVSGDSLAGLTEPDDAMWAAGRSPPQKVPVSIPLEEIRHVAVRRDDAVWVAAGITGVALAAVLLYVGLVKPMEEWGARKWGS
jgi:hypothetical protein